MKCHLRGHCKNLATTAVVVFLFTFFYEWLFHDILLSEQYQATASLWRSEQAMESLFGWLVLGQFIFSVAITLIFSFGYQGRGMVEGLRFGLLLAVLLSGPELVLYSVAPYPAMMVASWVGGLFVEMIAIGLILSVLYKPTESASL